MDIDKFKKTNKEMLGFMSKLGMPLEQQADLMNLQDKATRALELRALKKKICTKVRRKRARYDR